MQTKPKEFTAKLKAFRYLSYLILVFSLVYIVNSFRSYEPEQLSGIISGGVFAIVIAAFFWVIGKRERKIVVSEKGIEYISQKKQFDSSWDKIVLVQSYREENKETENLVVLNEDDTFLSVSTAFFDREIILDAFEYIVKKAKEHEHITIEDDRAWLKNRDVQIDN